MLGQIAVELKLVYFNAGYVCVCVYMCVCVYVYIGRFHPFIGHKVPSGE